MTNNKTPDGIVVAGAAAYDQIATSRNPVTNADGARLNFKLDSVSETFGGCSANIAYNLAQVGAPHQLLACTGALDQDRFVEHCQRQGMDTDGLLVCEDQYCSRALIITDPDGHQITGFYPGPEPDAAVWRQHLARTVTSCRIWIQSPYPTDLMLTGLEFAKTLPGRPLRIWNPGQYAEVLSREELAALLAESDWIVVNRHELSTVETLLGRQLAICTHSADPVEIRYPDRAPEIIPVPLTDPNRRVDPTGCGDAFIAGMVSHLVTHEPPFTDQLGDAVRAGMRTAAACLAERGAQVHRLA